MNLSEFKKAYHDIKTLKNATKLVFEDEEFLQTIFKEEEFQVSDYEIMMKTRNRREAMRHLLNNKSVINAEIKKWNEKTIKDGELYLNNKYGQLMLFDVKESRK